MAQQTSLMPAFIATTLRTLDNVAQAAENCSIILRDGTANLAEAADLAMQIQMTELRKQLEKAQASQLASA